MQTDITWKAYIMEEHIFAGELLGLTRIESIRKRNKTLLMRIIELKEELKYFRELISPSEVTMEFAKVRVLSISIDIRTLIKTIKNPNFPYIQATRVDIKELLGDKQFVCCNHVTKPWKAANRMKCWQCGKLYSAVEIYQELYCVDMEEAVDQLNITNKATVLFA